MSGERGPGREVRPEPLGGDDQGVVAAAVPSTADGPAL